MSDEYDRDSGDRKRILLRRKRIELQGYRVTVINPKKFPAFPITTISVEGLLPARISAAYRAEFENESIKRDPVKTLIIRRFFEGFSMIIK